MRVPLSWLAEWVDLPPSVTPEDVHEALVSVGLEEEAIHQFDVSGPVVVGEVLDFVEETQSNGKTIRWCQVAVADDETPNAPRVRGIVCGANNFDTGDKVVVALPGSTLPGPFPITARKTYGHTSDGMIASAKELGLGDDHSGILRLATLGIDAPVGTDAMSLLGLDDVACEVNVTPDRGYALSIRGIAREYHHATGAVFRDPAAAVSPDVGSGFPVAVLDDAPIRGVQGCEVFITRVVRGIDVTKPTPAFMVSRLALAGMRSISLPVDVTNYVMLELGQPIHAYDLDTLAGGITVRRAKKGETLITLDEVTRVLDPEDLLITDDSGAIGMAGVMGGHSTEISDSTTNVLIEAAWFDPVSIARTQRRHKLPSEASKRFARGVDPLVASAAAERVVELLETYAGGTRDTLGSHLIAPNAGVMPQIPMAADAMAALAGIEISRDDTVAILEDIGATVGSNEEGFLVTPPSWRPDVIDQPSLVEEVARIVGYDTVPALLPAAPAGRGLTRSQSSRRRISNSLAAAGLTEVLSYPFVSQEDNEIFGHHLGDVILANPLDSLVNRMRVSLIPGLLDTAHRNYSRGFTSMTLFEGGLVFLPKDSPEGTADIPVGNERPTRDVIEQLYQSVPNQPWHVAGLFLGEITQRSPGQPGVPSDVASALDAARVVGMALGVELHVAQATHPAYHPGRYAELQVYGETVGFVGEVLPAVAQRRDVPTRVSVFSIDVDRVLTLLEAKPHTATPISGYPATTQDVSLVAPIEIPAGAIRDQVAQGAGDLLEAIHLVDDYRGEGIEPGHRSLTFALRFRAPDRTLTQAEATAAKDLGVAQANSVYGAVIRA
jgi:phenylalanyl-tRNA synthetase beta chain